MTFSHSGAIAGCPSVAPRKNRPSKTSAWVLFLMKLILPSLPLFQDEYTSEEVSAAREYYNAMTEEDREKLTETIVRGLPGVMMLTQ